MSKEKYTTFGHRRCLVSFYGSSDRPPAYEFLQAFEGLINDVEILFVVEEVLLLNLDMLVPLVDHVTQKFDLL